MMSARDAVVTALAAWVLWQVSEDHNVIQDVMTTEWAIVRAYDSLDACRQDEAKAIRAMREQARPGTDTIQPLDDGVHVTTGRGGRTIRSLKLRALCLPGTLDPRPPRRE
jgi:hypothetical protein